MHVRCTAPASPISTGQDGPDVKYQVSPHEAVPNRSIQIGLGGLELPDKDEVASSILASPTTPLGRSHDGEAGGPLAGRVSGEPWRCATVIGRATRARTRARRCSHACDPPPVTVASGDGQIRSDPQPARHNPSIVLPRRRAGKVASAPRCRASSNPARVARSRIPMTRHHRRTAHRDAGPARPAVRSSSAGAPSRHQAGCRREGRAR